MIAMRSEERCDITLYIGAECFDVREHRVARAYRRDVLAAMGTNKTSDAGWRGSRELWLVAAYDNLVESGVGSVRIQPLSKKLALSRTSFYWFFTDREALLETLLKLWRDKNSGSLIALASAYADSITEALFNVFDCWLAAQLFDSGFEFAVRSWALQSPEVGEEIRKADEGRVEALVAMFLRFGFDATAADVRTRTIYLTQIGYISLNAREDMGVRLGRIPQYVELFSGRAAKPHEPARFHARHCFTDARSGARWEPASPCSTIFDVDLNRSKRNTPKNAAYSLRHPD